MERESTGIVMKNGYSESTASATKQGPGRAHYSRVLPKHTSLGGLSETPAEIQLIGMLQKWHDLDKQCLCVASCSRLWGFITI